MDYAVTRVDAAGVRALATDDAPPGPTARRWAIWLKQMAAGHEPCFGTEDRYTCADTGCPYRAECLRSRADWLR
ncbi:MAG: hypothetical protein IRZ06_01885 [Nevskia sp.]|nr:hypothetical protein [Nevskia sp.]